MTRKRAKPLLEKIRITDIGAEGKALARVDNQVIFVPMLVPGDIVDIQVTKKHKKYMEGRAVRFHELSSDRIKPVCRHFGECGGCKWQHLPYELQLRYKKAQVMDNLRRIGKTDIPDNMPIIGSEETFMYRNKLEYTFSDKRWLTWEEMNSGTDTGGNDALGFHVTGLFDKVMDITECHLQPEPSGSIRDAVRRFAHRKGYQFFNLRQHTGFLRNLIIRNTLDGKFMVIVVFFLDEKKRIEELMEFLASEFPQITSLFYVINNKANDSLFDQNPVLYKGDSFLTEEMDGLKFRIGPKSFYQTNTKQASVLYGIARDFAGLTGKEIVYDLYTGTGTIASFIAPSAEKVIGIEYIEEAVNDALINSRINNISNTFFYHGDIKNILSEEFVKDNGHPDVIITDPPRAGMHPQVIERIVSILPERIVYISCNPATQARDIFLLSDKFYVSGVQPVDMFPQTHHIENVILMNKKGGNG